jgi:hypothetical protein
MAIVADDPDILLKAAVGNNAATIVTASGIAAADVGSNIGYFTKANATGWVDGVNTATGNSATVLDIASVGVTVSLPFRIVEVVPESVLSDGTFAEAIVAFNPPYLTVTQSGTTPFAVSAVAQTGGHQYRNHTGI